MMVSTTSTVYASAKFSREKIVDYRFVSGPLLCIRTTVMSKTTLSLIGAPAALLSLLKEIVAAAFERVCPLTCQ